MDSLQISGLQSGTQIFCLLKFKYGSDINKFKQAWKEGKKKTEQVPHFLLARNPIVLCILECSPSEKTKLNLIKQISLLSYIIDKETQRKSYMSFCQKHYRKPTYSYIRREFLSYGWKWYSMLSRSPRVNIIYNHRRLQIFL